MPTEIQFPEIEPGYVFELDCLTFRALADEKLLECLVTGELLLSHFGATAFTEEAFREAFDRHKPQIHAIARQHIENGWIDEENRVVLTTRFTRLTVTFGNRLGQWAEGHALAASAHRVLTEIIGPNAAAVGVEWNFDEVPPRQPISLRITDPALPRPATLFFGLKVLEDPSELRLALAGFWGSILRSRSNRLFLKSG